VQPGDTIWAVNGEHIQSPDDLTNTISQLEPGQAVDINISRPNPRNLTVTLADQQSVTQNAGYSNQGSSSGIGRDQSYDNPGFNNLNQGGRNSGQGSFNNPGSGNQALPSGSSSPNYDQDSDANDPSGNSGA